MGEQLGLLVQPFCESEKYVDTSDVGFTPHRIGLATSADSIFGIIDADKAPNLVGEKKRES